MAISAAAWPEVSLPRVRRAFISLHQIWDAADDRSDAAVADDFRLADDLHVNVARFRPFIASYIVPLDMDGEGRVIEFLLVPYFGACIHVPPPPSNQIVHATSELGVRVDELYQPYWIEGPLKVEPASSELAEAGYRMVAQTIELYELD